MAATHGFRVAYASHDTEQNYISVFHFLAHSGAGNVSDLASHLNSGAFPTALKQTLASTGFIDQVTVTNIRDHGDTTPPAQDARVVNIAGAYTFGSSNLPRAVCGLVKFSSNVAGRGTHGWSYGFPVIDQGRINGLGTKVTGAYLTALQLYATDLNGVLTVAGIDDDYDLAVFSRARWSRGESNYLFGVKAVVAIDKVRLLRRRELR